MKKLTALGALVVFLLSAAPAAAQTFGFGAHGGLSFPVGDYGSTNATDAGAAEMGFSGGLDLWFPLMMVPGLSWYTSVDAIAHSTDEAAGGLGEDAGYLFFPLMTGVQFDIPAGPLGLYVTGQLGAIFARPPTADLGAGEVDGEFSTEFGFSLGAGAQFTDLIYGGLKYYPLGDVDWSWEGGGTITRPVSFLDLYVGIGVR